MTLPERLQIDIEIGAIAGFGLTKRVEQQVRNFRHGRHNADYRSFARLF